jgi:tetratricopeptide (TPR) repeat protein
LTAEDLLALADTARSQGEAEAALTLYRQVASRFPAGLVAARAQMGIGDLQLAAGEYDAARDAYSTAAALPGSPLADTARLAVGNAYAAEFEALDSGTAGFVDEQAAGEFLVNLEAIEHFRELSANESMAPASRATAAYKLGEAYFRGRQFRQARQAFAQTIATTGAEPALAVKAHLQSGLAYIQEGDSAGAEREFLAAGATAVSTVPQGTAARPQFGGFALPPAGSLGLQDLVITVQRTIASAANSEDLGARADLGLALDHAHVLNDLPVAIEALERLARRRLPAPVGDLALFELADLKRKSGDPDGAVRDYQALLADYPGSPMLQLGQERLAEVLFELFDRESRTLHRIEYGLIANLQSLLRRAVGNSPQPPREARTRALEMLGRLDAEGIPLPLTIAQPRGLSTAYLGTPYLERLEAFGVRGVARWSLEPGSTLPEGLALSPDGVISGMPSESGTWFATFRAADTDTSNLLLARTDSRPFQLVVEPFSVATPSRLRDGVVGQPYSARLEASGREPFRFEPVQVRRVDSNGRLETLDGFVPGLGLAPDGTLAGTPTRASVQDPYLIAVRVTDATGSRQAAFFALSVTATGGLLKQDLPSGAALDAPSDQTSTARAPSQLPALSAQPTVLATVPASAYVCALTPDGSSLVVAGTRTPSFQSYLALIDLASGVVRQVPLPSTPGVARSAYSVAISPDGRLALATMFSPTAASLLHMIELAGPRVIRTCALAPWATASAFTPDGRKAIARAEGQVFSLDLAAGTTSTLRVESAAKGRSLVVFPDSRRVLVAAEQGGTQATVVDLETGSTVSYRLPTSVTHAQLLPDGQTMILNEGYGAAEKGGTRLYFLDLRTGSIDEVFAGLGTARFAVDAAGATAVVAAATSRELAILDVPSRRVRRVRVPFSFMSTPVALSPDGAHALVFDGSGPQRAWLVNTRTLEGRILENAGCAGGSGRTRALFTQQGQTAYSLSGTRPDNKVFAINLASPTAALGLKRSPLPPGELGSPYSHQLQAQGGQPGYTYQSNLAGLVPGLGLEPRGLLAGTPLASGLHLVEGSVADTAGTSVAFSVPLLVKEAGEAETPLSLLTRELAAGVRGMPYRAALAGVGGVEPYSYAIAGGALPAGVVLSSDGLLSGRPTEAVTATCTFRVGDAAGSQASRQLRLSISQPTLFAPATEYALPALSGTLLALDLDRDGRDDLVVGHNSAATNLSVMLANPDGTMGTPRTVQVRDLGQPGTADAARVSHLTRGDFNGDGVADLVAGTLPGLGTRLPTFTRPALFPFLGDGRGGLTLMPAPDIPASLFHEADARDVNGDGLDDLIASSYLDNPLLDVHATTYVQLSRGDGTFSEGSRTVTSNPLQVLGSASVLGEFTGDSHNDLASLVSTASGSVPLPRTLRIYRGDGTGRFDFVTPTVLHLASEVNREQGLLLGAARLNGDSRSDFVVLGVANEMAVVLSTGSSGYSAPVTYPHADGCTGMLLCDLDEDGASDVVLSIPGSGLAGAEPGHLATYFNRGDGRLGVPASVSAGPSPCAVTSGDFNGDGLPDLAVVDANEATARVVLHRPR